MTDKPKMMAYTKFKELKPAQKKTILRNYRLHYSDKEIRSTWELNYNAFYYYVKQLDTEPKADEPVPVVKPKGRPKNKATGGNQRERVIIDAEYEEVFEEIIADVDVLKDFPMDTDVQAPQTQLAIVPAQQEPAPAIEIQPIMSFQGVTGTLEQLRKRLDGMMMILESEGDNARFKLNITVFKEGQ